MLGVKLGLELSSLASEQRYKCQGVGPITVSFYLMVKCLESYMLSSRR